MSTKGIHPVQYHTLDTKAAADKTAWDALITYAQSLGVPANQCDFLPPKYEMENYYK